MATDVKDPATETVALVSIADRGSTPFDQDGSYVADPSLAQKALDAIETGLTAVKAAFGQVSKATELVMVATFDLREVILRGDNGEPDWAGRTAAYRTFYKDRIGRMMESAGLTRSEQQTLQRNVNQMTYDRGYRDLRIAQHEVASNQALSAKVKPEDLAAGKPITGDVRKALNKAKAKQVATTGKTKGAALAGFEPASTPTVFGPPKAQNEQNRTGAGNTGQATAAREFDALFARLSVPLGDKERPVIAPLEQVTQLHRLATAASKAQTGQDDQNGGKRPSITGKPQTVAEWRTLAALATKTADFIAGDLNERSPITEHYWQA